MLRGLPIRRVLPWICQRSLRDSSFRTFDGVARCYHWVYKDSEDGYNEKEIEERFSRLSSGGSIDLKLRDGISVVTIDNVAKRNAFTGTMLVELRDVVKRLWDCKETKAVVLCGAGNAFCSGLDLSLAAQLTEPGDGADMCMYMQNTLTLLQLLPSITVAAIRGPALGGGAEVTTATDFRLVFSRSIIQFVHKKMGIIPGWGGVTRLRDIVGPRKTVYLLASSEPLDSKCALLVGLADALASDADDSSVVDASIEWLERTFSLSETEPSVFRAIKTAAYGLTPDLNGRLPRDFMLRKERDILSTVWGKSPNKKALNKVKKKL